MIMYPFVNVMITLSFYRVNKFIKIQQSKQWKYVAF